MMILINIILIYLIVNNIYFYNKKKTETLGITRWYDYFVNIIILLGFFFFFILFIRILNLFRESKTLDIKLILNINIINLILIFLFILSFRRLVFFLAKSSFFRLHYFYLSTKNNPYYIIYYKFYINIIYNNCVRSYNFLWWLDKLLLFILIFFFFKDIVTNNFILNEVLIFVKFYGLFKFLYLIVRFVALKQDLLLDYYLFNIFYEDILIDEGFFADTLPIYANKIDYYQFNIIMK